MKGLIVRELNQIRNDFELVDEIKGILRLMNELEHDYGVFVLNPSEDFLNKPEVVLYREISASRAFWN